MVEILVWGDIQPELDRLGIKGTKSYQSADRRTDISVWALTQEDYQKLLDDPADEEHWFQAGVAWRAEGGTNLGFPDCYPIVAHRRLFAWHGSSHRAGGPYQDLLTYLEDSQGLTTVRNVAAAAADLARFNGLSLAGLFAKYQG